MLFVIGPLIIWYRPQIRGNWSAGLLGTGVPGTGVQDCRELEYRGLECKTSSRSLPVPSTLKPFLYLHLGVFREVLEIVP